MGAGKHRKRWSPPVTTTSSERRRRQKRISSHDPACSIVSFERETVPRQPRRGTTASRPSLASKHILICDAVHQGPSGVSTPCPLPGSERECSTKDVHGLRSVERRCQSTNHLFASCFRGGAAVSMESTGMPQRRTTCPFERPSAVAVGVPDRNRGGERAGSEGKRGASSTPGAR
jgi:hypothetical protein